MILGGHNYEERRISSTNKNRTKKPPPSTPFIIRVIKQEIMAKNEGKGPQN